MKFILKDQYLNVFKYNSFVAFLQLIEATDRGTKPLTCVYDTEGNISFEKNTKRLSSLVTPHGVINLDFNEFYNDKTYFDEIKSISVLIDIDDTVDKIVFIQNCIKYLSAKYDLSADIEGITYNA